MSNEANEFSLAVDNDTLEKLRKQPTMILPAIISIPQSRYDELVAKEERLRMLEFAILQKDSYETLTEIKTLFGLKKGIKENE